jgi:hypothetical protein
MSLKYSLLHAYGKKIAIKKCYTKVGKIRYLCIYIYIYIFFFFIDDCIKFSNHIIIKAKRIKHVAKSMKTLWYLDNNKFSKKIENEIKEFFYIKFVLLNRKRNHLCGNNTCASVIFFTFYEKFLKYVY